MVNRIETEIKLELNEEEFGLCQAKLVGLGCVEAKRSFLTDYFFNIEKFDDKGWNFTRIRVYDGKNYEKTRKVWELNSKGERIRREEEEESSELELNEVVASGNYFKAEKVRTDYQGKMFDLPCVFSFDKLAFSDETRYFMEAELDGVPEDESDSIRVKMKEWLLNNLNLTDRSEGIGMMKLVLSKAGVA